MNEKVLIAMSGGVDSSVAAMLMLQEGHECLGATLKLHGENDTAVTDARQVADTLSIPHYALDFTSQFQHSVIQPFIESYERGLTPNPCVMCNKHIKFGELLSYARQLGCTLFATGHYAQTRKSGSRWLLEKAADPKKDQSYVLYNLSQEALSKIRFPLGTFTKDEVRHLAADRRLATANKADSQDICFVPDGDYAAFIESYTGKRYAPGNIEDENGSVLGRHRGLIRYTLGQRRGLGVALNAPVYVTAKDTERNTVTLGPESALYAKTLTAVDINLIASDAIDKPIKVMVKTRYLQQEKKALAVQTGANELRIEFEEAQRSLTPGQAAVLYDGNTVLGGGIIASVK